MRRGKSRPKRETIVLYRAFRPFLNAAFAGVAVLSTFLSAVLLWEAQPDAAPLLLVAAAFFSVIVFDAAIPSKLRVENDYLHYRDTFLWTSWPLDSIKEIRVEQDDWLGLPVSLVAVLMKDGRNISLTDTTTLASASDKRGGAGWAVRQVGKTASLPANTDAVVAETSDPS